MASVKEQRVNVSGYVEQVLREHLGQYKDDVERWRKLPYSMNAVTRQGLIIPFSTSAARCVFVTQTAVCTTKTLAPKGR